jgi:hypothetical protein
MPAFAIVPVVKWTVGAVGSVMVVRWVFRESRRINAELGEVRAAGRNERAMRHGFPTLRRDPATGEYRL